jgi:molybdopterin-guanine dinucleotide biosynthesis protein A
MGLPKHLLPFGPECLLQRVVRRLGLAVEPIVVVASHEQEMPTLPGAVRILYDREGGRGPMEGLCVGLSALGPESEAAFVIACDVPRLVPALVTRMVELLGDDSVAVPVYEGLPQPLAAVYRREVAQVAARLLAAGERRVLALFDAVPTRRVPAAELLDVEPELTTLRSINEPADYLAALASEGLTAAPETLQRLSAG